MADFVDVFAMDEIAAFYEVYIKIETVKWRLRNIIDTVHFLFNDKVLERWK